MTTLENRRSPLATVAGVAGAVGGWALEQYSGASLIIPAVAALALLFLLAKSPIGPRHFLGAICLTSAHVIWFVFAAMMLGNWAPVIIDVVVLVVAVSWLWIRPGLLPAIFLALIEAISLGVNAKVLLAVEVGSEIHRSLVVHVLLRIGTLICLGVGYRRFRRDRLREKRLDLPRPFSSGGL